MLYDGVAHGASGLVAMGAVVVAASGGEAEDVGEVVADFAFLHVEVAEAFDAGGVDDVAAMGQGVHFVVGGGVHAGAVAGGDGACAQAEVGQQGVDEGGLAHSGVAGEQGDAALDLLAQFVEALALYGGDAQAGVADAGVELHEAVGVAQLVEVVGVFFVDDDGDGDVVGLRGCQEAVDEGGGGLGVAEGDDEEAAVDVGGYDVGLPGEVGGAPDDVVAAGLDVGNDAGAVVLEVDVDVVAYGDGVGGLDGFEAEVSLDAALYVVAVFGVHSVPAACAFCD